MLNIQVTGIDISEDMIEIARRNNRPETYFHVTDVSKLEVVGEFDVAVSCLVLMVSFHEFIFSLTPLI